MKLLGWRKRGRPQRRFTDVRKDDMQRIDVSEEDARDRLRQRLMICCSEYRHLKEAAKRRSDRY